MHFLLSALIMVFFASPSLASVTSFTINNHSNRKIQCAVAQIVNANPQAPEVSVIHWFVIENGTSMTHNGRTDGFYCESWDRTAKYAGTAGYLCISRGQYVNPIYRANRADVCNSINGEMVGFHNIEGFGAKSITIN
ncbi:MAG: hypothetical protein NTV34_07185 [Proteobacteria bacterium]|nr:hypothetical protein [Pseudomonadota bacterium]